MTITTTVAGYVEAELFERAGGPRLPVQVTEGIGAVSFTVEADGGPIVLHCMATQAVLTGPAGDGETGWAVSFGHTVPPAIVLAAFRAAVADGGVEG